MLLSPAFTGLTGGLPSAASAEVRADCAVVIAAENASRAAFFAASVVAASRAVRRVSFAVRIAAAKAFSIATFDLL